MHRVNSPMKIIYKDIRMGLFYFSKKVGFSKLYLKHFYLISFQKNANFYHIPFVILIKSQAEKFVKNLKKKKKRIDCFFVGNIKTSNIEYQDANVISDSVDKNTKIIKIFHKKVKPF